MKVVRKDTEIELTSQAMPVICPKCGCPMRKDRCSNVECELHWGSRKENNDGGES